MGIKETLKENILEVKKLVEIDLYHSSDILNHYGLHNTPHTRRVVSEYLKDNNIEILFKNINSITVRYLEYYKDQINEWYNIDKIVEFVNDSLKNRLIINKSGNTQRYVIAFKNHKNASKANQVKAHIVLWELHNKKPFPENHILQAIDGDFLNLNINNFKLWHNDDYRSFVSTGERNHFHISGLYNGVKYKGGWNKISKDFRSGNKCAYCGHNVESELDVHHIISYHLFENKKDAHNLNNLICLCSKCHASLHGFNYDIIRGSLSETVKEKLIELLGQLGDIEEGLKSYYNFSIESISSQGEKDEIIRKVQRLSQTGVGSK